MKRTTEVYKNDELSIEYSIVNKGGSPILVMHGGHSNCNEEFGYTELEQQGYSILTPSRPGYGKTSPNNGLNLSTACNSYIELLNHLKLDKVHVIGISAGGPSAIYFTSKYQERVKSLTLQSAVSKEWLTPKDKEYKAAQMLFHPSLEKYTWKLLSSMINIFPKFIFKQMAPSFSKLSYAELKSHISDEDINKFKEMIERQRSGQGFFIDLSQTGNITLSDLQSIKCPTLILHSQNDRAVSIEHAYNAHNNISNSKLCILNTWGHLIWLGQGVEEMNIELFAFLHTNN
ncbi:Pimeloyl-ACP methyl ester carboxylesterase [Paenibacillus uliginis N3/975]|uniref:Pimeloyl-ACP methyl ester carboxylesterase n=1 Tax=Paenibacillus uliginis N3/975 TaxID=1313296 RepID=A0A1X7HT40_9BACL|nr:alpha/beta hydrolase [Paenibacillus uliginis]SMF92476.1 Pimeloyl-ACP methyl ester carboxylesterase [Paenibacillus uliginis N3/975]